MNPYIIETKEGCAISCNVEGNHVAAALDELLCAKRGEKSLLVPHLAEGLILRISMMRPIEVVAAASNGGCMPGMVLHALDSIKRRAVFWHNKAVRYQAAEEAKLERIRRDRAKEEAAIAASRPELEEPGQISVDQVGQGTGRKRPAKAKKAVRGTSARGKASSIG